jgi:hypothetical protein
MKSDPGRDDLWKDSPERHLAPLREYRRTVLGLFPERGRQVLDGCPFSTADALFLGCFLDHYSRRIVALEVGACAGASAFWLASHPKVSGVTSINQKPPVNGLSAERSALRSVGEQGRTDDIVLHDITRAALDEYPKRRERITLLEGRVDRLPAEALRLPEDECQVALLDDPGTPGDVVESLDALFGSNPRTVVFLENCRRERGPFVQAGVVAFLGSSQDGHRFRLAADLGPAFAGSGIGILYPRPVATEVERTLEEIDRSFSRKLDPLRLLAREEELMDVVRNLHRQVSETGGELECSKAESEERHEKQDARLRNKIARLETRIANLKAQNAALRAHYSSRRYRWADALAERVLRVRAIERLVRRRDPPPPDGSSGPS